MLLHYLIGFILISGHYCAEPMVETPLGKVLGYTGTSYNGRTYLAFEGIPYAKPPTGERRFEEPEPIDPWDDILDATAVTSCVQIITDPVQIMGDEDCLHVNVYVPREEINTEENLEVVVHIHGGAFTAGSGNLYSKPTFVTDKDVIFVTFNYRLSVFGFLSTEDEVVPGNNGLKDQVLALKWIKNNIASFGGNTDSITVFGLSAGSTSLHLHYLSDQSKGLFHRGFCQSGLGLNPGATTEGNVDRAKQLAGSLDCPTDSSRDLVDCLKQVPSKTLAEAVPTLLYKNLPIVPFGPVVEKSGSNPFIGDYPYNLLSKGHVLDVPLIVSNVAHEGTAVIDALRNQELHIELNWNELAPLLFDYNYTLPQESWVSVAKKIREHYFGEMEISLLNNPKLVQAFSDRFFLCDGETAIRLQAKVSTSPIYYYIFAYGGDNPVWNVPHGAEINYMYGPTDPRITLTDNELKMKDFLWDMIVSYAKTGVPSFEGVEWQPTTYEEDRYLYVWDVDNIETNTADELTDREFWHSLNFAENENLA